MPINSSGQGFSENTQTKQVHFRYFVDVHLGICRGIFDNYQNQFWLSHKYHYIDLNSGPGITEEYGEGSPVIFLQEATEHKVNSRCYFVDINESVIESLKQNTSNFSCQAEYLPLDNHLALEKISGILYHYYGKSKKKLYGLLYSDENGTVPFEELAEVFSQEHLQTLDILIYFSATTVKRCLKSFGSDKYKRLTDYIYGFPKKHWQIRQAQSDDKQKWSFLFGTNWENKQGKMGYPQITQLKFYDLSSRKGQAILEDLAYTSKEKQERIQPNIPGIDRYMN